MLHAWLVEDLSGGRVRILTHETQIGQLAAAQAGDTESDAQWPPGVAGRTDQRRSCLTRPGIMGAAMARNLARAGHTIRARAEPLSADGALACLWPAQAEPVCGSGDEAGQGAFPAGYVAEVLFVAGVDQHSQCGVGQILSLAVGQGDGGGDVDRWVLRGQLADQAVIDSWVGVADMTQGEVRAGTGFGVR